MIPVFCCFYLICRITPDDESGTTVSDDDGDAFIARRTWRCSEARRPDLAATGAGHPACNTPGDMPRENERKTPKYSKGIIIIYIDIYFYMSFLFEKQK